MKFNLTILFYLLCTSAFTQRFFHAQNGNFNYIPQIANSFTLPSSARTSAGIYKPDSTLVRTLWSGEAKPAGTYQLNWDGTNDTGAVAPIGNYNIKVLSNNITYDWQGIIGNTSLYQTGPKVQRSLDPPISMVVVGNNAYYCVGYGEGEGGNGMFSLDSIQVKDEAMAYPETGQNTDFMATDGTNIYWAGYDAFTLGHSFMFATKVSDKSEVTFTNGVNMPVTNAHTYTSAIGYEDGERIDSFPFNSNLATTYTLTDSFPEITIYRLEISGGGIPTNNPKKLYTDRMTITNGGKTFKINDLDGATVGAGATIKVIYWQKKWPTGIAASGSYIYISRKNMNEVQVLNKTTGALLQRLPFTTPGAICTSGSTVWLCTGTNTVTKYSIGTNGILTSTGTVLSGFTQPITMSTNGTLVALVDGGSSQQIKAFDFNTGAAQWTFGQVGGHIASPVVANDRFGFWKFNPDNAAKIGFGAVAFQSDGSFWICDPANYKMAHFAANRTYIEGILYTGRSYSLAVDLANPTRVINAMKEYQVDYTSPIKSSWAYKYNWQGTLTSNYDIRTQILHMCTLSNGRTYAIMKRKDNGNAEIVELDPTIGIRYTGLQFESTAKIYADGSIGEMHNGGVGEVQYFYKRTVTGYSGNNPVYSGQVSLATHTNTAANEPRNASLTVYPTEITSSNILVLNKGGRQVGETQSYHLGGFDLATGTVKWKTALPTFDAYQGAFPDNGDYEVGNFGVNDGGQGDAGMAIEKNIFTHYYGEFWKNGQTNRFNHYYDNGLFVGQFGTDSYESPDKAATGMAGNAFSPVIVKVGSDYYMYHNDESHHGGTHRWKISNLGSVALQTIPIDTSFVRSSEAPVLAGTDLMAGLPYRSVLPGSVGTVTRTPSTETTNWQVKTNAFTYQKRKPYDIYAIYTENNSSTNTIDLSLGSNSGLTTWSITGQIAYDGAAPNTPDGSGINAYLDVLDNTGKIIVRLKQQIDYGTFITTEYANNTAIMAMPDNDSKKFTNKLQNISFVKSGSNIVVTYAGQPTVSVSVFDAGSNIGNPTKLQLRFTNNAGGLQKKISINQMRFFNN
jgi:hypothetical protein